MTETPEALSYTSLLEAFKRQPLFEEKTWRLSPQAWPITPKQYKQLEAIGKACLEFYKAQERLYRYTSEDRNLLRNDQLKAPWVAEYLNRGKPSGLIQHAKHELLKHQCPKIMRPDLLMTEDGFRLTELDSVPGGIGLTAYLNRIYEKDTSGLIGSGDRMLHCFYNAVASACPETENPVIAIVVSDEAATYRPEFEWVARELRQLGHPVYCLHPDQIMPLGKTLCAPIDGNPEKIDIIYRFFELFDLRNVSTVDKIFEAVENGEVIVTPPMRHFQEEKLSLALFHHHLLEPFWIENLSRQSFKILKQIIPMSWIVDPVDLPPNAVLHAPYVNKKPISDWKQLCGASQKERNLILKISGFHENAWGARSVVLGSDVSRDEWQQAIHHSINESENTLHILQAYHKPMRIKHNVYSSENELYSMDGRVRLCPYYFIEGDAIQLPGILATFCPSDKKIIHGMKDAAMLPSCQMKE